MGTWGFWREKRQIQHRNTMSYKKQMEGGIESVKKKEENQKK